MKILALTLPSFLGLGCAGIGFEKAWDEAVTEHHSAKSPDPVCGPWTGTWKTDTNGHEGKLRCLVTPTETSGNYDFRYHATWFKFLRGGYRVNYDVQQSGDTFIVEGSEDLGLFGDFDHKGRIEGDQFTATYSNQRGDVGSFEMKRPDPES